MEPLGIPAVEILYERYAHLVHRRCVRLLGAGPDAEDALQETFIQALRAGSAFRGESSPMSWLYRVSTNICLNSLRSRKRREARVVCQPTEGEERTGGGRDQTEEILTVRELLPGLDGKTQQIVVGLYVDEMSLKEVAGQVGLSIPTARKLLNKFLARARKRLAEPRAT